MGDDISRSPAVKFRKKSKKGGAMKKGIWLLIVSLILAVTVTGTIYSQRADLSEADIQAAIAKGLKGKGKEQGLVLEDSGQKFLAAMSNSYDRPSTGFSVVLYTPTTWIEQQASNAAKEYRDFTLADVDEFMRRPILRAVVNPDTPNTVNANGVHGTSSVQHVVLRDESRKTVIQPSDKHEFTTEASNAMGARKEYVGLVAEFPLEKLGELRGANGDREFFVTVIGETGEEKNFKIKKKHFERLP